MSPSASAGTGDGPPNPTDGREGDGGCRPFGGDGQLVGHRQESSRFRIGGGGNEDLPARGVRLKAPGEVHCAADHAILGALLRANMAHHHLPGVNTNAHINLRQGGLAIGSIGGVQPYLHGQGTGNRPFGIVSAGEGGAKQHQQAIAQNLDDRAPVGENDVHHRLQIAIEKAHDLLRFEALGEGCKAPQIRHQNGHLALDPAEL